jgi:hypothetical protein
VTCPTTKKLIVSRRRLIKRTAAFVACAPAIINRSLAGQIMNATHTAWPGQENNPVGYAAAPSWTGTFANSGSPASPTRNESVQQYAKRVGPFQSNTTYYNLDFDSGPHSPTNGQATIHYISSDGTSSGTSLNNVTFVGCRFQSNSCGNSSFNVQVYSSPVTFSYCTFQPRVADVGLSPPGYTTWPSAGAGLGWAVRDVVGGGGGNKVPYATYQECCTDGLKSYQYVIFPGIAVLTVDHCDMWGFGGGINVLNGNPSPILGPQVFTDNWLHDYANCIQTGIPGQSTNYHTDGIGYTGPGLTPTGGSWLIRHNTLATLGNTGSVVWQSPAPMWNVRRAYPTGFQVTGADGNLYHANAPITGGTNPGVGGAGWTLDGIGNFHNVSVINNFFSGQDTMCDPGFNQPNCSGLIYTDNVFSWTLPPSNKCVYVGPNGSMAAQFSNSTRGNHWRRNVVSGGPNDGKFATPNGGYNPTDWNR